MGLIAAFMLLGVSIPLLFAAGGVGVIFYSIWALERADSPFVKIFRDAVRIFCGDFSLMLVVGYMLGAVGLCAWGVLDGSRALLPHFERLQAAGNAQTALFYLILPALAGSILAACLVACANAILADYFLRWTEGKPDFILFAALRVASRFWRIIEFTLLWSLFAALLCLIKMEADEWLRRFKSIDMMLTFLYWAVDFGLVMAAYFMLVVMVRERVGAWTAFLVTLEITREELGSEVGELARIKTLDMGVLAAAAGVLILGIMAVGVAASGDGPMSHLGHEQVMTVLVCAPMGASLLIVVAYYVLFQTLQLFLAAAVYRYLKDGQAAPGFSADDFDHVLGLRACGISTIPKVRELLGLAPAASSATV